VAAYKRVMEEPASTDDLEIEELGETPDDDEQKQ